MTGTHKAAILSSGVLLLLLAMMVASMASNGYLSIGSERKTGRVGTAVEQRIDINTATIEDLRTKAGFERQTAVAIVSYREQNGRFRVLEELMDIPTMTEEQFLKSVAYLECV